MLYRGHLLSALSERREDFVAFERAQRDEVGEAAARLCALGRITAASVRATLGGDRARVTLPSVELDARRGVVVPFDVAWRSHEEARAWARGALEGRATFAADGSQIFPGRDVSMPVAAVQVASFENSHTLTGEYTKEISIRVVTPHELLAGDRAYESPEQVIGVRRFELEVEMICGFLERKRGWRASGERLPLAFLDGALLISSRRKSVEVMFSSCYADALVKLIKLSRETEVPVVGFIDQSYAPDLRDLLEAFDADWGAASVFDAQILRASAGADDAPLLGGWGDRTIFWHCRRVNLADSFYDERGEPLVGFVYAQTTGDGAPARVEVPAWVYEAGALDEVLDAVRAECVVGNGYPYAIETADEAAVMTARDRQQFLRVMQDFAGENSFAFRVSRKAASKARRR
jgi:hypothetical protein